MVHQLVLPKKPLIRRIKGFFVCREEGIRTLDTLLEYTHFPGVLLQPLGHLSVWDLIRYANRSAKKKIIPAESKRQSEIKQN